MKKLIIGLVIFVFMFSVLGAQSGEYKQILRFGVAPLEKDGVHNQEELYELLNNEQEAIVVAGRQITIVEFQKQIFSVQIYQREFRPGEKFLSMTYRNWNNKIMDVGKWEWAGKKPFPAFVFFITYNDKEYWFIIPEKCGNICLWKVEEIESKKTEIRVWPSRISTKPSPEPELKPEPKSQLLQKQEPTIKQPVKVDYFVGAGAGAFYSCFMEYALGEIGARRHVSELLDVIMSIAVGVPISRERADWKITPIFGFGLQSKVFDPFYFGIEVGLSGKMKEGLKTQAEFGAELGFRFKDAADVYLRARAPFDEKIGWNYKIILGLRMFF